MIDDIVELPRTLKGRSPCTLSSYRAYEPPTSAFGMMLGISVEVKDLPIQIGNEFDLLAGKESPYRYKIIEHDGQYIREYMTISDGPITSKDAKIFTLWMNRVARDTLKVEKFYFWDIINEARDYYGFQKCAQLSNEIRDIVAVSGALSCYPGLERSYMWANKNLFPITDETGELDRLNMIRANASAIEEARMSDCFYHPEDIFRGVNLEFEKPIRIFSGAGRILSNNVVVPKDLKKFIGPDYATKPYHMCLRSTRPLQSDAEVSALAEYTGWFDVLKYIELIPYSELFVAFNDRGIEVMRAYDPYDHNHVLDLDPEKMDPKDAENFTHLREELSDLLPMYSKGTLYRSWGEEVYITTQKPNCKTKQFYFDLVYAALGSRLFTPVE